MFQFVAAKEESVAGLARDAKVLAWIVVHCQSVENASFEILLDGNNGCRLSIQGKIQHVRLTTRANAYPVTGFEAPIGGITRSVRSTMSTKPSVECHQLVARQLLRSLQQRACPFIAFQRLLFGIGKGQNAQGQQLVDLSAVEKVAGALGGDLGEIVQNDRRGQDEILQGAVADQNGPGATVLAGVRQGTRLVGWINQREKSPAANAEDGM